jgi:hypothetical protein
VIDMGVTNRAFALFLGLVFLLSLAGEALAQGSSTTTVVGRPRPQDALGIQISSFTLFPSLTTGAEYNDNIFASDGSEKDDVIFAVSPSMSLQSDWSTHALGIQSGATIFRYADNTSEDVENYNVVVNGRVDILRDMALNLGFGYAEDHEERGDPNQAQNAKSPTEFTVLGGQAQLSNRFNRVYTDVGGQVRHLDYDDTGAIGGGTINNDDRDRMEYQAYVLAGLDFHPDASAFIRGTFNHEDYDDRPDDGGFDRNSYGYGVDAGIRFDLTGLVFGELFGGLAWEEYEDPAFTDSGPKPNFGGGLSWNVTPLTTVNFDAAQTFEETTVNDAAGTYTTDAAVGVNHELLRNLLLNAGASYKWEDYQDTSRNDHTIVGDIGATYLMNRYVHVIFGYSYTQRWSDAPTEDYTENVVGVRFRVQY